MTHTKAIHLKSFKKFILTRASEEALEKIYKKLTPSDREIVTKPWMVGQWVDYDVWWRLLCVTDNIIGSGDYRIAYEIGAFDAIENLNGVYKAFISILNVKMVISQAGIIWHRYYDTGVLRVVRLDANQAELHLENYPGLPKHHEMEIIGWMETALKLTGAKRVKLNHTTCIANGDDHCTFVLDWEQ